MSVVLLVWQYIICFWFVLILFHEDFAIFRDGLSFKVLTECFFTGDFAYDLDTVSSACCSSLPILT